MDTIKKYNLLALFLLVPFAILAGGLVHVSHTYALTMAILIILASQSKNKWIFIFVCYACIWQVVLFLQTLLVPRPDIFALSGLSSIICLTIGVAVYVAVEKCKISLNLFYNVICISAIIQLILAYMQWIFGTDPYLYLVSSIFKTQLLLDSHATTGSLGNNNYLAAYLVMSAPFFMRGFSLKFYTIQWPFGINIPYSPFGWWAAIPFILVMLYAAQTSMAVIAFAAGVFVYGTLLLKSGKVAKTTYWLSGALVGIAVIWYAFFYHPIIRDIGRTGYSLDRYDIWIYASHDLLSSWSNLIFGFGPGAMWARPYPMHSEWLTMIHQYGLIGLGLMLVYVITTTRTPRILFLSFVIIFVNILGNSALHFAPSAFLIIIVLGLLERESHQEEITALSILQQSRGLYSGEIKKGGKKK